jgi:hypothetical protein
MGIRFGPIDPLQLVFNVMNSLMKKGLITYEEAREILKGSLDSNLSEEEKEKIIDSLIIRKN